jgi:hypothetical protein
MGSSFPWKKPKWAVKAATTRYASRNESITTIAGWPPQQPPEEKP